MKGVLLPHNYVVRASYKTDIYYRSTFIATLLGLVVVAVLGFSTYTVNASRVATEQRKADIEAEETAIANRRRQLRPTIESYAQVKSWELSQRVAFTPLLSWLEENTPPESAVNSLEIVLGKVTPGAPREGTMSFTTYISDAAGADDTRANQWVYSAKGALASSEITVADIAISESTPEGQGRTVQVEIPFTHTPTTVVTPDPTLKEPLSVVQPDNKPARPTTLTVPPLPQKKNSPQN